MAKEFRVTVKFWDHFGFFDFRSNVCIYISSSMNTIEDLKNHLNELFKIDQPFYLALDGRALLHPNLSIRALKDEDIIFARTYRKERKGASFEERWVAFKGSLQKCADRVKEFFDFESRENGLDSAPRSNRSSHSGKSPNKRSTSSARTCTTSFTNASTASSSSAKSGTSSSVKLTSTSPAKPTSTSSDKPAATSSAKPTTTSSAKLATTSVTKPIAVPSDQPAATSVAKPTATSSDKPAATSPAKPAACSPPESPTTACVVVPDSSKINNGFLDNDPTLMSDPLLEKQQKTPNLTGDDPVKTAVNVLMGGTDSSDSEEEFYILN